MTPPEHLFLGIPAWVGVYLFSAAAFLLAGYLLYARVFRLVMVGRPAGRTDRLAKRLLGAIPLVLGQSKVLQSFSPLRDRAGLAHFLIFWGFVSFALSYVIFIFGDSAWRPFSTTLLTETGVQIFAVYLEVLAVVLLVAVVWGAVRRWAATPRRLSFDLTQKPEAAIILVLIGGLMALTLLTEAFHAAAGGNGPASAPLGSALGDLIVSAGIGEDAAGVLHALAWWAHLGLILGFAVYIPMSKHAHLFGAPLSFLFRDLEASGALSTPDDLETAETFGAARAVDFTWKELLDGYACAVCGRCTDSCPANITGKTLSPMHIAEGLKEHLQATGAEADAPPVIGAEVGEEALWDCLTCGACEQVCPVGVEHIDMIVDMRRNLVMEQASMPETAASALMSMEQRGHPWRGTQHTRTDWADGLGVRTLAEHPDAEVLFWVGCTAALEQRSRGIARSMASVLKRAGVDFAILGAEEGCTGDPGPPHGQRVPLPGHGPAEHRDPRPLQRQEDRHGLPPLLQHHQERVPPPGRQLRGDALQRVRSRAYSPGQDQAGCHDRRVDGVPRLVLPGPPQRGLRRAPRGGRGHTGAQAGGDGAAARARLLLRRGRRAYVDGGEPRPGASTTSAPSRCWRPGQTP